MCDEISSNPKGKWWSDGDLVGGPRLSGLPKKLAIPKNENMYDDLICHY